MKQMRILFFIIAILAGNNLYAEYIHYGTYTVPGDSVFDGDLVIVNGNLESKYSFTVNGDLKVIGGKVSVTSSAVTTTVDLHVYGDLIVTNTKTSGMTSAKIEVLKGKVVVTGDIFIKSDTLADFQANEGIIADNITAISNSYAEVYSNGPINCKGAIYTRGYGAVVLSYLSDIFAGSIGAFSTGSGGWGSVIAQRNLVVKNGIDCRSVNGRAYVGAANGFGGSIKAGYISLSSKDMSYIYGGNFPCNVEVDGAITTTCDTGPAYVRVVNGYLKAGSINTCVRDPGYDAYIKASGEIYVKEDITTSNTGGSAYVESIGGKITAKSISTDGGTSAYVKANSGIEVLDAIRTECKLTGSGAVMSTNGDIVAKSIITKSAASSAKVSADNGRIFVDGPISTVGSSSDSSAVIGLNGITAEHIYTRGGAAHVLANGGAIDTKGHIDTKALTSTAYVSANNDINAISINTDGITDAYVKSANGSITVVGDISTKSVSGDVYVNAPNGNINAQRVIVNGAVGVDNSIKAAIGSANLRLALENVTTNMTIQNSELHLDKNCELKTSLTLLGTCTLDGKGYLLNLGGNGRIIVGAGAKVYFSNILIDKVGNGMIKCLDDAGRMYLQDTTWSLTSDYILDKGAINVNRKFTLNGPGKNFYYQTTQASTILANSELLFNHGITLNYNSGSMTNLSMVDATSRLHFSAANLNLSQNMRITKGTLVVDNELNTTIPGGRTLYFGDGTLPNNMYFDIQVGGRMNVYGSGQVVNQLV